MKHRFKIIACILLSISLTFSTVIIDYLNITQIVYAKETVWTVFKKVALQQLRALGYILSGDYSSVVDSIEQWIKNEETFAQSGRWKLEDGKLYCNITIDDSGKYHLDSDIMKTTEKAMNEYISSNPDFVMIPTTKNTSLMPSYFKFSTLYETVSKHITDLSASYVFVSADGKGGIKPSATPFVIDLSNSILIGKSSMYGHELLSGACYGFHKDANGIPRYFGHLYVLDKKTVSVRDFIQYDYSSPDNGTTIECSEKRSGRYGDKYIGELNIDISTETSSYFKYAPSRYYFYTKDGKPLYLFKDAETAINYVYGKSNIYRCTPEWEGSGECVVKPFTDEDYQKLIDAIQSGITSGSAENEGLTPEDIQKIIDGIIGTMQDIGGDITEGQETANSWLSKIYDLLKDIKASIIHGSDSASPPGDNESDNPIISDIRDLLEDIKGKLSVLEFTSVISALSNVASAFSDLAGFITEPLKNVVDSLKEIVGEAIRGSDMVDDVISAASGIVDAGMSKFPFSIPRDMFLLFNIMRAEPVAPHWKVPLVFMDAEYSIEIDFTEYESVAKVSRAFLTVSFLIGLLFITRRLMHND